MPVTRRELLFGLGGGVAGLTLTPLPWKLLDDVSIWTQHRRALPIPPHGEVTFKATACPLCPAGCALRVRCVGARPVAVVGERAHPLGGGSCALGLTLHHLAYHPLRLASPARRVAGRLEPCSLDSAVAEIAAAAREAQRAGQSLIVLDRRPGRAVSEAWRELLGGLPHGRYVTPPSEGDTLLALEAALESPGPLGVDLENARTLVSFGAPLLEGWDRPGRVLAARKRVRVVQVDTWRSPTAATADEWLPIAPGAEGSLALALAHVVAREQPDRADEALRRVLASFDPRSVGERSGVAPSRIESLGRELLAASPAIAIGGGDPGGGPLGSEVEKAIAVLNVVLGSVGRQGGIVPRRGLPLPEATAVEPRHATLAEVPEGSVRVAILDGADDGRAVPWAALGRVLAKDALVVSLSPFHFALARRAQLLIPAPAPLEVREEVLSTAAAALASYALSAPVLQAAAGASETVALAGRLAQALGLPAPAAHEERLKRRVTALHAAARGRWLSRAEGGYAETAVADAEAAWQLLEQGGCWIDSPGDSSAVKVKAVPLPSAAARESWRASGAGREPVLVACAARGTAGSTPVSPLLTKLYQESDLRLAPGVALVHPDTARGLGLLDARRVRIEGPSGSVVAELRHDPLLPPGRLVLASGPERTALHAGADREQGALVVVAAGANGAWRETPVRVQEA